MAMLSLAENLYVTGDKAGALENYIQAAYLAGRGSKHKFPEFEPIEASAERYTNNCCWLKQGKIKQTKEEQEG